MAGSAAWLAHKAGTSGMDAHARSQYTNAQKAAPSVSWLARLAQFQPATQVSGTADAALCAQIENLEAILEKLGTTHGRKYDEEEKLIATSIMENASEKFELGHEHLGTLLGFKAGKEESTGSPDPWWVLSDELCLVFEDHSDASPTSTLDVTKARQVASHPNWVKERLKLPDSVKIFPVLVTPVAKAGRDAMTHLKDVYVWKLDEFRAWANTALRIIRELRRDFPGSGDLAWRAVAAEKFQSNGLDANSIVGGLVACAADTVLKVD
jgi:hypothetical protein